MTHRAVTLVPFALVLAASGISADPGTYDDVQTSTGPTFVEIHEVGAFGAGACFSDATFPFLSCATNFGSLQSFHPARFDVSSWNSDAGKQSSREVRVWVEAYEDGGLCSLTCSFSVAVCADRDDDRTCTDGDDDVALARSGEPFVGDGTTCESDTKVCDDSFSAEATLCLREDSHVLGGYDEVLVHTGVYVEEPLFGPEGTAGVEFAMNFFDVHVEYGDWGCTASPPGVPVHITMLELGPR